MLNELRCVAPVLLRCVASVPLPLLTSHLVTLSGCYPFYQKDPFILEECPHVYFSGNAPNFQSKVIKGMWRLCSFILPFQASKSVGVFVVELGVFTLGFPSGPGGQEVLLVSVPEFSSTQTACLVNLRTLCCQPVTFSTFSPEEDMNISH